MKKLFTNKVALITGGNTGIGRATAIAFADEGAKVVIAARRVEEGMKVIGEIKDHGSEGLFVQTDVTNLSDIKSMVDKTISEFGQLDFAFNNAGVEEFPSPLTEKNETAYNHIMDTNVKGVLFSMQQEINAMLKQGGGVIINNSSIAGVIGIGMMPVYIASKHAVIGLTKAVALEFARQKIRVNAVCPGVINTEMYQRLVKEYEGAELYIQEMNPAGRIGMPEEIASAVIWLCSPGAAFVTGQAINIDGGFTTQ
jgi:NAD(P)-dependent dehydrogenase (short-subunit alcohol dehydrogenase family)